MQDAPYAIWRILLFVFNFQEEPVPYSFFVGEDEIKGSLSDWLSSRQGKVDTEKAIDIVYQPQAVFRVRPVTRCTSSMPGIMDVINCRMYISCLRLLLRFSL